MCSSLVSDGGRLVVLGSIAAWCKGGFILEADAGSSMLEARPTAVAFYMS
jgi:hypothetical protein